MALNVREAGAEGPLQPEGRVAAAVLRKRDVDVYHRLSELVSAMGMNGAAEMPCLL